MEEELVEAGVVELLFVDVVLLVGELVVAAYTYCSQLAVTTSGAFMVTVAAGDDDTTPL